MNGPVRLQKVEEHEVSRVEAWLLAHANIIVPILLVLMMIMFVVVAYALVGVSATESGVQYNHLQDVI